MTRSGRLAATIAALAVPVATTFCKGSSESPSALNLALVSGNAQVGVVGAPLALPLVVKLTDQSGHAVAGATVAFATGSGGTLGTPSATTDSSGQAQSLWTLGAGGGTQTATASSAGAAGSPVTFNATAATTVMAKFAGDGQTGLEGWAVNVRPAVKLTGTGGTPVSGTSVTFAVTGGGGSVTSATVVSNASGIAQVGSWVLGGSPGTNTVTASAAGLAGSPVTFTATGQAEAYPIQIMNIGPPLSAAVQAALDSAQAKWQRMIYRSVGVWPNLSVAAGQWCDGTPGSPAINQSVAGLLILVKFDSIDGPGKILGEAGPCYVRPSTDFSIGGLMFFDTADVANMVANGTLNSVMLHEMGHVIGFGTLWNFSTNCLDDTSIAATSSTAATANDTYFGCANAQAEFDSVGGTSYTGGGSSPPAGNIVPVENCGTSPYTYPLCGVGTINSHWREVVLGNELMTGYINTPGPNPLSVVTLGSFADEGYGVNYSAADTYTRTFTAPPAAGVERIPLGDDILHRPIYEIDRMGRVVRVRPAP